MTNEDFPSILQEEANRKMQQLKDLLHEKQHLDVRIERTKRYVNRLNDHLRDEGRVPVEVPWKENDE